MPIKINGATSGSTTITAPATGSDETIELSTALASKLDLAGGKILQIVRATDSTDRTTTSATFVDGNLSVTITPKKSDSAIILIHSALIQAVRVAAGSTAIAYQITDSSDNPVDGTTNVTLRLQDILRYRVAQVMIGYATPATTSAVTYKVRFNAAADTTAYLLNALITGQLYAIEVSA